MKFKIIRANNGDAAVELCRQCPDIRLAIINILIENVVVVNIVSALKQLRPDVPVIAVADSDTASAAASAAEIGCDDFVSTSHDASKLKKILTKYI
jgi:DNA-binding NtrC family response regulator